MFYERASLSGGHDFYDDPEHPSTFFVHCSNHASDTKGNKFREILPDNENIVQLHRKYRTFSNNLLWENRKTTTRVEFVLKCLSSLWICKGKDNYLRGMLLHVFLAFLGQAINCGNMSNYKKMITSDYLIKLGKNYEEKVDWELMIMCKVFVVFYWPCCTPLTAAFQRTKTFLMFYSSR